jgi:quinol monooxygenase YgiN
MQIYIFTRFYAQPGKATAFEEALREVVPASRQEEGCLNIHAFRSIRDPHVFYIHSRWRDEAAFDAHAKLPHTRRFIELAEPLLDHEIQAQRCELIA